MLKSPSEYLYPKFPLIQDTLSWKTSLLVRSEISGLFGNTLTADHMYSRNYLREISATCLNAVISKTENIIETFFAFSQSAQNFVHFEKKNQLHSLNISEVIDSKKCGFL